MAKLSVVSYPPVAEIMPVRMISFSILTKSILATLLLALAMLQLTAIAIALGWLGRFSPQARRRAALFHRLEGYAALVVILTIAYDCIFVIRPNLPLVSTRAQIHAFLGASVLALIFVKMFFSPDSLAATLAGCSRLA